VAAEMLCVGIDEVGYGPKLGPLVLVAAAARGPLRPPCRLADSKKLFSPARGLGGIEPAALGYAGAPTLGAMLERLGTRLPDRPWYAEALPLPAEASWPGLDGCWARFVDPGEFNEATRARNKSDFLFDAAAELINRVRAARPEPIRFLVGKQGGRRFYRAGLEGRVAPGVRTVEERRERSAYEIPGASIEFLMDAEDRHELVALASMIGKYLRERAMELLNGWGAGRAPGLKGTAGYGTDATRWFRRIGPLLAAAGVDPDTVWRRR
jgi:hypothetical protein